MAVEKDVRAELGKLPAKLKEQYGIIYRDILESAHSTMSIACRTFSWILAAQRVFTVEEMIAAVALDDDGFYHTDLDVSRLLDICRNLVVVTPVDYASKRMAFQMVHLSVREFLEQLPEFSAEQIHAVAVSRLLDNFNSSLWLEKNISMREKSRQVLRSYTIYLFEHAEMSSLTKPESDLAPRLISFLFDENYHHTAMFNEWLRVVDDFYEGSILPKDFPDWSLFIKRKVYRLYTGALELVCMHGLLSILQILGNDKKILSKALPSESLSEALSWATFHGQIFVVKWLLERQILHPGETQDYSVPALRIAICEQYEDIASLLLEHGADPLSGHEDGFHSTPWSQAFSVRPFWRNQRWSVYVNYTFFKRLYDRIEFLHMENPDRYSSLGFDWKLESLFKALRKQWDEASHFLIGRGANDCSHISQSTLEYLDEDERQPTTLQIAVKYSRFTMIDALLDRSLKLSSYPAQKSTISFQITPREHQAYLNHLDHHERSALHYLMDRQPSNAVENEKIMKLLLRHGADPTVVSKQKLTALHIAAAIGSTNLIRDLVRELYTLLVKVFIGRPKWSAT